MPNALVALGGAFLVAGVLARVGRRIGLPTIPLFMGAGILTGPHTPGLVLIEDPHSVEILAALGLVMLLFHLGLEFSLDDLRRGGRRLIGAGSAYVLLNVGGGFALGAAFGWGRREAFVIAGAVGISSSAIVTKLLIELRRLANRETPMILGIIVFEDVFLALYLAILQAILSGAGDLANGALLFGRALVFLLALVVVARWGAGVVGRLVDAEDDELITVLFVGLAVLVAGFAEELGVSDAIGALMVGLIIARTRVAQRVHRLVLPLRDAFGALFFFAFGLTIDPGDVDAVWHYVAVAALATVVLNVAAGWIASRIYRFGTPEAMNAAFTLVGRGEFSLILTTLALSAGVDRRVGPFVALYVLVLALAGPVLAAKLPALLRRKEQPAARPQRPGYPGYP